MKESKLKELREAANLSQRQLEYLSKVSARSIQDYEQGRRNLSKAQAGTVQRLSKALKCTMEELLDS